MGSIITSNLFPSSPIKKEISSRNHLLVIEFTLVHNPVLLSFNFFETFTNSFLALILSFGAIPSSRLPRMTSDLFDISASLSVTFFKCGGKK